MSDRKVGRAWLVRSAVLLVLVAAAVFYWQRREPGPELTDGPPAERVARRTIEMVAEASGTLEPLRWVEVKSLASGEVLEVLHETGELVKEGALLAKIDPRDVDNAWQQAVADLEAAKVRASTTKSQKDRLEALRKSNVVTDQEYESAIDSAATAKAALVRAQTNLQLAQERRRDATIRAPITGTLIERAVEPGQIIASATSNVSGGTVLFRMADLSTMQVRAKIDETDIGAIAPGQPASVKVEAYPGAPFRGVVQKIEPQSVVEQNVTMFPVLIRLDNAEGLLRPGMNTEVSIQIERREDVLSVTNGAIASLREARGLAESFGISEEALSAVMRRGGPGKGAPETVVTGASGSTECATLLASLKTGGEEAMDETTRAKAAACAMPKAGGERARARRRSVTAPKPGMLFVKAGEKIEPRRVMLGLADWDHTEILEGVAEDEEVVVVTLAQQEQSNQRLQDRIRSRSGMPGAGGKAKSGGRGR